MRFLAGIVSALFTMVGIMMIGSGDRTGWWVTGFFGSCMLVAIFEKWLPRPDLVSEFQLVITPDEIACEHRKRTREAIRWEEVERIWYVRTSDDPLFSDRWLVFERMGEGCSVPTDAQGFDRIWDELEQRFPGFDYAAFIHEPGEGEKRLCWERETARVGRG